MVREDAPKKVEKPKSLGIWLADKNRASTVVKLANAIEAGR